MRKLQFKDEPKSSSSGNFFLLVITVLFCFIFFEVSLRVFFPQNLNDQMLVDGYKYQHRPNIDQVNRRSEFVTSFQTNSLGLRDYEYEYRKSDDVFRIFMSGASMAEALQVENNETAENLLENKLNNYLEDNDFTYKGREINKFEIWNLGHSGYSTDQAFLLIRENFIQYQPDFIIFQASPFFDPYANLRSELFEVRGEQIIWNDYKVPASLSFRLFLASNLHSYVFGYQALHFASNIFSEKEVADSNADINKYYEIYSFEESNSTKKAWNKTEIITREYADYFTDENIPVLFSLGTSKEQINVDKFRWAIENYQLDESKIDLMKPQQRYIEILNQNKINYVDNFPIFLERGKDNELFWEIDGHYNQEGNIVLSEILFNYLKENLLENGATIEEKI
jgi:hypothetical protein